MMSHDDSDWADLASELGLETKPKPKPYSAPPVEPVAPVDVLPFPETPWPQDPNPDASGILSFSELPDAPASEDDHDTMIDPQLANEEYATDEDSAEGESESEGPEGEGDQTGKKRRRRRRRRKGGPGEPNAEGVVPEAEAAVETKAVVEPRSMADAIKNLVVNWNVPGWNEIVGGLYRPGADRAERDR